MSPVVGLKHDPFAGGGVPLRIFSHSSLCDGAAVTMGSRNPTEARGSSSIGRNSDYSSAGGGGEESGEAEVQSALKGPLDTMDVLELCLPISQTSNYLLCKSKSLSNLQGDSSPLSPAQDLAASSNRKRKKQQPLLFRGNLDSNRNTNTNTPPKATPSYGKMLKRLAEVNQSMPTLGTPVSATAVSSSSGSNSSTTSFKEHDDSVSGSWLPKGLLLSARRR